MNEHELDAALARFDVPPLSAGFDERVVAAAATRTNSISRWSSRSGRAGWGRRAGIAGGGIAFGLLSAAAAAAGYFGEPAREAVREAPVIGTIIAQVDPPSPKPVAKPIRTARPAPPQPAVAAQTPPPTDRRTVIAGKIRERIETNRQQRAELGLSPQRPRVQIRQAIRELPPEERRAFFEEVREARRERIAERWRRAQERRARWAEEQAAQLPDEGQGELAR